MDLYIANVTGCKLDQIPLSQDELINAVMDLDRMFDLEDLSEDEWNSYPSKSTFWGLSSQNLPLTQRFTPTKDTHMYIY